MKKEEAIMRIKTLEFIHQLLLTEKEKRDAAYKAACDLLNTSQECEAPDRKLIAEQREAVDEFMKEYFVALNALEDFEGEEW